MELVTDLTTDEKRDALIASIERGDFALSYSSLKQFAQSPAHFMAYKLGDFVPTDAMNEGTLLDMMLTEPERIPETFIIAPAGASFASKAGLAMYATACGFSLPDGKVADQKAMVRDMIAETGKVVISQDTFDRMKELATSVKFNRASSWIIKLADATQHYVEYVRNGWKMRGKMDFYAPEFLVADLKKTASAAPRKFGYQVRDLKLSWQGAIYTYEEGDVPFYNIAVDNYGHVSVHEHSPAALDQAWYEIDAVIEGFERCRDAGDWDRSYDFWPSNYQGIYRI